MGIAGAGDGDEQHGGGKFSMKSFLWHGGSVWDAWFSCASNQVRSCWLLPFDAMDAWSVGHRCVVCCWLAGGAGAADAALLLLAAGHGLRRAAPDLLRPHGQLDRLPHQRPLRRVPRPQGEGRRQLQEPRHPGPSLGSCRCRVSVTLSDPSPHPPAAPRALPSLLRNCFQFRFLAGQLPREDTVSVPHSSCCFSSAGGHGNWIRWPRSVTPAVCHRSIDARWNFGERVLSSVALLCLLALW